FATGPDRARGSSRVPDAIGRSVTKRAHNLTSREVRTRPGKPARLPGCVGRLATIENAILIRFSASPTLGAGPQAARPTGMPPARAGAAASAPYRYHTAGGPSVASGPRAGTAAGAVPDAVAARLSHVTVTAAHGPGTP